MPQHQVRVDHIHNRDFVHHHMRLQDPERSLLEKDRHVSGPVLLIKSVKVWQSLYLRTADVLPPKLR